MTLLLAALLAADQFAVEALAEAPPAELSEAVRKELAPKGLRVLREGKPWVDLWFRAALPMRAPEASPLVKFPDLAPTTLVGALRVPEPTPDFRSVKLPAGVYTLRYDVQPMEEGEHLNTADTLDFLVLVRAAEDPSPATMSEEDLHERSSRILKKKHPAVLYLLRPAAAPAAPAVVHVAKHKRWILELGLPTPGPQPLPAGIVVSGRWED